MNITLYIMLFIVIFIIIYDQRRRNELVAKQLKKLRNKKERTVMTELAKRFIDKECIVYTFNAQLTGTIKEVTDTAILVESDGTPEIVNTDYIVRIREYPKNKKGKKKAIVTG